MEKEFVTLEIANRLKELGYKEPCLAQYVERMGHVSLFILGIDDMDPWCEPEASAPTWQSAIDWLREKHDIYISSYPIYRGSKIAFYKNDIAIMGETQDSTELFGLTTDGWNSYEEARKVAVTEALKHVKI